MRNLIEIRDRPNKLYNQSELCFFSQLNLHDSPSLGPGGYMYGCLADQLEGKLRVVACYLKLCVGVCGQWEN